MAKKKSFNLVKDDKAQKPQDMYAPPKCRCMKFIAIPAIIGFILLLILPNVNFDGDDWEETVSNTTTAGTSSFADTVDTEYDSTEWITSALAIETEATISYNTNSQTSMDRTTPMKPSARASSPRCNTSSKECNVTCTGNVYDIYKYLEDSYCTTGLHVVLENCEFQSGNMDAYFFTGTYKMLTLRIENCNLHKIAAGAFKRTSVANLISLSMLNSQLTELTAATFEGLSKLEYFQVINSATSFSGSSFLVPFASTINTAVLQFKGTDNVCDLRDWITGANYAQLSEVNLMNNNFGQLLTQATFATLQVVQQLLLKNCSIRAIQSGTFEPLMHTLQYLDLRQNYIQTLGEDFFYTLPTSGFRLELSDNAWDCNCENELLLETIKSAYITYTEEPLCLTPEEWSGHSLRLVTLLCNGDATSSSSTMQTTNYTEKIISTTEIYNSTTEGIISTTEINSANYTESITPIITTSTTNVPTNSTTTEPFETTESTEAKTTAISPDGTSDDSNSSTESESSETFESVETSESFETTEIVPSTSQTPTSQFPTHAPPIETTTANISQNLVHIKCKKNGSLRPVSVRNYDVLFSVYTISCNSVKLKVLSDMDQLECAYFLGNDTSEYERYVRTRKSRGVMTTTNLHIDDLECQKSYVYCMYPTRPGNIKVSPFNCRGHYLQLSPESAAWLLYENVALFVCMCVLGLIFTLLLGTFGLYWLLRWRPTWLKGTDRVKPIENQTHKVFLLPKHSEHDIECPYACCYHVNMDPSAFRDGSRPQCQCQHQHQNQKQPQQVRFQQKTQSNDYMVYYQGIDRFNERRFAEPAIGSNKPPIEPAPSLPSDRSSTSVYSGPSISGSSQTTVRADDLKPNRSYKPFDYEYSSFELYEEIL